MKKIIIIIIIFAAASSHAQIKLPDINIPINTSPQPSVTSDDLQKVREEVLNIFDMYEQQVRLCQDAKEQIRVLSLKEIDSYLQELDRIRSAVQSQELNIKQLNKLKESMTHELSQIKRRLRQLKRNRWLERTATYAIITFLTIKTIQQ